MSNDGISRGRSLDRNFLGSSINREPQSLRRGLSQSSNNYNRSNSSESSQSNNSNQLPGYHWHQGVRMKH